MWHHSFEEQGVTVTYEEAREVIYKEPYASWKEKYQKDATPEQLAAFKASQQGE